MEVGSAFTMHIDQNLTKKRIDELPCFTEFITCIDHTKHVFVYSQRSCITGSNRVQFVLPVDDGVKAEYVSVDAVGGCIAWLVAKIFLKKLHIAFEAQAQALKKYCEHI